MEQVTEAPRDDQELRAIESLDTVSSRQRERKRLRTRLSDGEEEDEDLDDYNDDDEEAEEEEDDVEETVTQVLTQLVQDGGEEDQMSVELLQEQVELNLGYSEGSLSKWQNRHQ